MERTVVIKLSESDAKLLMQYCCMSTEPTIKEIFEQVKSSYELYELPNSFEKHYSDFDPRKMSQLANVIMDELEEALAPDEIIVDCRKETGK